MTDLPEDDEHARRRQQVFSQLVVFKNLKQAKKKQDLIDWRIWYQSLDDSERASVDEHLAKRCDEIAAKISKGRPFRPPES